MVRLEKISAKPMKINRTLYTLFILGIIWLDYSVLVAQDQAFIVDTITLNRGKSAIDIEISYPGLPHPSGKDLNVWEMDGEGNKQEVKILFLERDTTGVKSSKILAEALQKYSRKGAYRFVVAWRGEEVGKDVTFPATVDFEFELFRRNNDNWLNLIFGGVTLILLLLILLGQLFPLIRGVEFRIKYVKSYKKIKVPGRTQFDPITGMPFEDDDLVVVKCSQVISLDSWKYNNNRCHRYPDCLYGANPCTVGKNPDYNEYFFDQKGTFRLLNWVWFGALGGFSAWLIWAGFRILFSNISSANIYPDNKEILIMKLILGFSLGLGVTFWLSYVEEAGQSRKLSLGRITLRSLLGGLAGALIFGLGYLMLDGLVGSTVGEMGPFADFVPYLLLGLTIGLILSLYSSIKIRRGLVGGIIAGILFYIIYFASTFALGQFTQINFDSEWGRMIGYIVAGGALGAMIVSSVFRKGDYELEVLYPAKFRRTMPISKWLKSGLNIYIGTEGSCHVFVKWPDPLVQPQHAELSSNQEEVFLTPLAETLINGRLIPVNKKISLRDGDIINLGKGGATQFQFVEKGTEGHTIDNSDDRWKPYDFSSNSDSPSVYPPQSPKPKITIRKRSDSSR